MSQRRVAALLEEQRLGRENNLLNIASKHSSKISRGKIHFYSQYKNNPISLQKSPLQKSPAEIFPGKATDYYPSH